MVPCQAVPYKVTFPVTRIRRGGYFFFTWIGDHPPRHVHVYHDGLLVMKWDLEAHRVIRGASDPRIVRILRTPEQEGRL
jgi:hypothetical protein